MKQSTYRSGKTSSSGACGGNGHGEDPAALYVHRRTD